MPTYNEPWRDVEPPEVDDHALRLLNDVFADFNGLGWARAKWREMRDLLMGEHWTRTVEVDDKKGGTKRVSEKKHIQDQGLVPLVMNHMSPSMRHMLGSFLQNRSGRMAFAEEDDDQDAANQVSAALKGVRRFNKSRMLEMDQLQAHLAAGVVIFRCGASFVPMLDRVEVEYEALHIANMFWSPDFKGRDLSQVQRIGELHEAPLDEICALFARDEEHEHQIRAMYPDTGMATGYYPSPSSVDGTSFHTPSNPDHHRFLQIWNKEFEWRFLTYDPLTGQETITDDTQESIEAENEIRIAAGVPPLEFEKVKDMVYHYYILSPFGHVIAEGSNPYDHEGHPYVVGFASYMDGRWWGLFEDILHPQRMINRLTVMLDAMLGASAKGVLIVNKKVLDNSDYTLDELNAEWVEFNGAIALELDPAMPISHQIQQITANAFPAGIFDLLAAHKQWIDQLSGITAPARGDMQPSGTPALLNAQQTAQASLTTQVYFDTFFDVLRDVDLMLIQLIMQFYTQRRRFRVSDQGETVTYNPADVRGAKFDVALGEAADTAVFRQLFEESLQTFLQGGHLTFRQFLEVSSHPRAKQLLHLIDRTNPLLQDASALDGANPALASALLTAAQSGDQEALILLNQADQAPALAA